MPIRQDSGVRRTEQDDSLDCPEAMGQIGGWPLELSHEDVSEEKLTATATQQAASVPVLVGDGLASRQGKRSDGEDAAALAIDEEGTRESRVMSWSQRSKQRCEFFGRVVAAVAVAVAAVASTITVGVSSSSHAKRSRGGIR